MQNQNQIYPSPNQSILFDLHQLTVLLKWKKRLTIGFEPRSLPSHSNHQQVPPLRRPQSGDWTHLPSLEHLSLESLKEPPAPSQSNGSTRRHTVTLQSQEIENKVPARTQAAIEKVAEIVNKMGGQIRTHVQDNGGTSHSKTGG